MEFIISAFTDEQKEIVKQGIQSIIDQVAADLDLSNLEYFIVPTNFKTKLTQLQRERHLREGYTNEEHGLAVGKALQYEVNGELKFAIFVHWQVVNGLYNEETKQFNANLIHHELCHIHDENVKARDVGIEFVLELGRDLRTTLLVHADSTWSEYFAVKTAYSTTDLKEDDVFRVQYL